MKKPVIVALACVLGVEILAGCGATKAETNTLVLQKGGKLTEMIAEDFSKDYYDEEELKSFMDEAVDSYVADHEKGSVKMSGYKVEEGKAYLTLKYADAESYADFKGVDLFCGTVVQAQTEGYKFDTSFVSVEEGEVKNTADAKEVLSADKSQVLILHENITVQVPGTIQYVSAEGTEVTAKDTVKISNEEEPDLAPVVYIIYN